MLLCATLLLIVGVIYTAKKPLISGNGNSAAVSLADSEGDQTISGDIEITTLPEDVQNVATAQTREVIPVIPVVESDQRAPEVVQIQGNTNNVSTPQTANQTQETSNTVSVTT